MATTPTNPTASPAIWFVPGSRLSRMHVMAAANSGSAPLSIPVTDDEIHCSAIGNIDIGIAIHTAPRSAMRGTSSRSMATDRDVGKAARARKPKITRNQVIVPGPKLSSPSAMSRNEAPQMIAGTASSPQSPGVNDRSLVPSDVTTRRRLATWRGTAAGSGQAVAGVDAAVTVSRYAHRGRRLARFDRLSPNGLTARSLSAASLRGRPTSGR